jgi:radical SAM superfamily enzyme YgiQ (UPF0313 family)
MRIVLLTLIDYPTYIPPLGTACLASVLSCAGHEVLILSEFVHHTHNEYSMISQENNERLPAANLDEILGKAELHNPELLGLSCFFHNRHSTTLFAQRFKERNPDVVVVAGGPDIHPVLHPLFLENSGIQIYRELTDYLIQGEGEEKLLHLCNGITKGKARENNTRGIFKCAEITDPNLYSGYLDRVENLDQLPFPDFGESPDFPRYKDNNGFWGGIPISLSRGCSGNCSFCNRREYFHGYRHKSAEKAFAEIQHQLNRYQEDKFIIIDDDPLAKPALPEVERLCDFLIDAGAKFSWEIHNARLTPDLCNRGLADRLRQAGLNRIAFGVESFSPQVRQHIGKPIPEDALTRVLEEFSTTIPGTGIFLIYGYPTETEDDFQRTLEWLHRQANTISRLDVTCFILTDWYVKRWPASVSFQARQPGDFYAVWQSETVNTEVLWKRFTAVVRLLCQQYRGYATISDPHGTLHRLSQGHLLGEKAEHAISS